MRYIQCGRIDHRTCRFAAYSAGQTEQSLEDESQAYQRKGNMKEAHGKGEETLLKPVEWERDTAPGMCCFPHPDGVICPAKQVRDNMIWMLGNKCVSKSFGKWRPQPLYLNRRDSTIFENNCPALLASSSFEYSVYIVCLPAIFAQRELPPACCLLRAHTVFTWYRPEWEN